MRSGHFLDCQIAFEIEMSQNLGGVYKSTKGDCYVFSRWLGRYLIQGDLRHGS
jgi:hypothetical protein